MKKLIILTLFLASELCAIVTIKPLDVGEKDPGISGELTFAWDSNRGNSETDATEAGLYLQYDMNTSLLFIKSSYKYGESSGVKNIDKSFLHLRRIHKLFEHLDDEQFAQQQSDAFQRLKLRTLGGMGLRLHAGDPKNIGRVYFGIGAFYLTEEETELLKESYERGNFYLSYKYAPYKDYTFALVSYYQPRIGDSRDYLQLSTAELNLAINKSLSLKLSVEYSVNSLPPLGVQPYDYTQKTALKLSF